MRLDYLGMAIAIMLFWWWALFCWALDMTFDKSVKRCGFLSYMFDPPYRSMLKGC